MVVLDMPGSPLAWRSSGSADAPPAVFIHGLGGNRFSWEPQLSALADVRQCLACDLPGYGRSAGLPGTLPELAGLVAHWIAGLGRGPADVVGLSFGGMVAQHLALDHPGAVRTLALLDTSPAFGFDGVTTPGEWLATRVTPSPDASAPDTDRVIAGIVGPDCPVEVRDAAAAIMREVPAATLAASCRALVAHDTRDRLHQVTAPTLVMVGAEDTETPESYARAIAERIPGARLVVVPGAGHLLNVEAPEAVNDELRRLWLPAPSGLSDAEVPA
jgi:3-oxoadipate enol-lactonase/4-carboxymuconolactone decarboxylase